MASDDVGTDVAECWERRHELSVSPITQADIAQRTPGDERHLVLLARVTDDAVVSGFEPVLDRLGAFECLERTPPRNLHVTVTVLGNVVAEPDGPGQFSADGVGELAAALGDALDGCHSFAVAFPRLNLFPTVVFAEVVDDGKFARLNDRVCECPLVPVWGRDRAGFIPHVTLGHFVQQQGYERLRQSLEANRSLGVPSTTVDAVELVSLDFDTGRFPHYETVETYELG